MPKPIREAMMMPPKVVPRAQAPAGTELQRRPCRLDCRQPRLNVESLLGSTVRSHRVRDRLRCRLERLAIPPVWSLQFQEAQELSGNDQAAPFVAAPHSSS